MRIPSRRFVASAMCFAMAAGCGGGGGSSQPSMTQQTGTLSLGVTDAPVDQAAAVVVKFTGVEIQPENGSAISIQFASPKSIDLLALAGGGSAALIEGQTVPAGRYEWIRLMIEAEQNQTSSYIDLVTGERYPLFIPSGSQTGLKLVRGFNVAVGGAADFTIDFDLRKSVIAPPGQMPNYFLKPALRLVDNLQVGRISGVVAQSVILEPCSPYVYVFSGAGTAPDDMDSIAPPDIDPLISVPVELDASTGEYRYTAAFLEAGEYTVSFTCNGATDTAEGDEVLTFSETTNASVAANQTTSISFDGQ